MNVQSWGTLGYLVVEMANLSPENHVSVDIP